MPPGVGGHYRQNLSNPFNHFPQSHPQSIYGHHQQPSLSSFNGQGFSGAGFGAPNAHQNGTIFGASLANGTSHFNGGLGGAAGLGSQEAQMRFARGAAIQEQQGQLAGPDSLTIAAAARGPTRIREVWKQNLHSEMAMIRQLIDRYPYVSMDTEFPGIVARPMGNFPSKADYHYQCLRCNVDLLKLIQLGITLFSVDGEVPPVEPGQTLRSYTNNLVATPCTWTFNFQFSLSEDMYSQDSIDMLQKAGVDFQKCEQDGIDPKTFGSLLITSGLVLDQDVSWLSFHSGYDFGYLVKIMACQQLPNDEEEYLKLVRMWFPRIYDIKYLFRHAQRQHSRGLIGQQAAGIINAIGTRSGLNDLAEELSCVREGRPHTAGSDAWLTGMVFWSMRQKMFNGNIPEELSGMIWGLSGVGPPASAATRNAALAGHQTPNMNGATIYNSAVTPGSARAGQDGPSTPQNSHTGNISTPGQHAFGAMGQYNFQNFRGQ